MGDWYAELREALLARCPAEQAPMRGDDFPPAGAFIPLACFERGGIGPDELPDELDKVPPRQEIGGWRAMNLVCRRIDTSSERPWYTAAYWRTQWTRRLRRALASAGGTGLF